MKTAHQNVPDPQQSQDAANKAYVDANIGGGSSAVVFDDAVPTDKVNIRANRASNQSPINNAQSQITNLGSKDGSWDPSAAGATGKGSTIGGGNDNSASGAFYPTVAGGVGNKATSSYATVGGGQVNQATNVSATVGGGAGNIASGNGSTVPGGSSNQATADNSFAAGYWANARLEGQFAFAAGPFSAVGDAQTGWMVMRGSTPGSGSGESAELGTGNSGAQRIVLEDSKAYTILVSGVARGSIGGSPNVQSFRQMFAVRRESGTTVIAASGALEQLGDAASTSWTFVASVGAGPDRFMLTFGTGSTTSAAKVVAKVEITEVQNP